LIDEIRTYLDQPGQGRVTVDTFVDAMAVSRRQLFRAFKTQLGVTPNHFVKYHRLSRIRRELVRPKSGPVTVASIAQTWSITELGRFAGEYRAMFGELPSETLARGPQSAGVRESVSHA